MVKAFKNTEEFLQHQAKQLDLTVETKILEILETAQFKKERGIYMRDLIFLMRTDATAMEIATNKLLEMGFVNKAVRGNDGVVRRRWVPTKEESNE